MSIASDYFALSEYSEFATALDYTKQAIRIKPNFSQARYNKCIIHLHRKEFGKAAFECKMATIYKQRYARAHAGLGIAFLALERPHEAIEQHVISLQYDPQSGAVHFELGKALIAADRLEEGIKSLETAELFAPTSPEIHCMLSIAKGYPGFDSNDAEAHRKRANQLGNAKSPRTQCNLLSGTMDRTN